MDVTAVTRDGIEVNVPIFFSFRIDSGPRRPQLQHPWPIHRRDIYQAVFAEVVDPDGKTPLDEHLTHPWEDLPLKIAEYKTKQAVAFYSLFQLYEERTTPGMQVIHQRVAEALDVDLSECALGSLTRMIIGQLILVSVRKMLKPHGFHIYDGGIQGSIAPLSEELSRQRVEAWKTRWISKVMHWQAELQIDNSEDSSKINVGDASQIVESLIAETYQMSLSDDGLTTKYKIAESILVSLLDIARTPDVEPLLPASIVPTLVRMQNQGKGT
jgi:hypothetical protein